MCPGRFAGSAVRIKEERTGVEEMADVKSQLTPHSDLIFDVGMHQGKDTDFYLRKGFRVIAIEASPSHVRVAQEHFRKQIADGKLTIVPAAVAPTAGRIQFYLNLDKDDWGTISPDFAARNEHLGTRSQMVEVDAVTMQSILERHGVPYYLKIDIEGADTLCLEALHQFPQRPRFVSIEIDLASFSDGFDSLVHLWNAWLPGFQTCESVHEQAGLMSQSSPGRDFRARKV